MKRRARRHWAHWRIDNVMLDLCRRSHHHDLVLKKRAIGIVRMPKFWIENFVKRARLVRVERAKTNHMTAKIMWHIVPVTDFRQSTPGTRCEEVFCWARRTNGAFAIR